MPDMGKSSENQNSSDFFKRYGKHAVIVAVALVLVIIIVFSGKGSGNGGTTGVTTDVISLPDTKGTEPAEETSGLKMDAYPEINQLVATYFTALRDQDVETLSNIMEINGEIDKEKLQKEGEYIEDYRNIRCYTKEGIIDGTYLVFPYYDIKFLNVETLAPSMIWLYVCTNEDGSLYISKTFDGEVKAYIDEVFDSAEARQLVENVESAMTAAMEQDETLAQFVMQLKKGADPTIPTEPETEAPQPVETETAETQQPESAGGDAQQSGETVYAVQNVNIRKSPSTDGEQAGQLAGGEAIQRLGTEGDWSKVLFEGRECYIKSEFLTTTRTAGSGLQSVDEMVEVLQNVRMRKEPSVNSEDLGTLAGGIKVRRIGYSAEWSQIEYEGKTRYVSSEFLR